ncbi:hypothetical protein M406DRAFT_46229 [Cryphonectria parasitica EP155]|uniref:Arrestin-like N-terminal domain-containing protein n=1 Tax=Cryphonectria parasitica (strain ATCC 38755 / EP155) TaxID=660469 RepID=A0A9P4XXL7_CRYP1|nr:uncharacterized protein M406DRAFT_46229 [Cryphonectria parasitica EP155]KAF3762657.1 hypothetical protein M406DRAFT_46229 [Cryphonectria parasitica EP155]
MPPAYRKTGADLDIQIDDNGRLFRPGDFITGRVSRRSHMVSPMSTVEVKLRGRAKVKLGKTRYNGQSSHTTYYRGRFNFFGNETRQHLYHGPVHVPQEGPGESWEFAIQIPLHASPEVLLGGHRDADSSFLSLNKYTVTSTPLPSTFYDRGRQLSTKYETYVEYSLEASLVQQGSHGASYTATFLIPIRALSLPQGRDLPALTKRSLPGRVVSQRLVPGMEDVDLSFKQKTQKFFHSSKVPYLGLVAEMTCLGGIQLGAQVSLKFKIRPDRRNTSEVIHGVPQTAVVTEFELVLKARTQVVAPGTWHPCDTDSKTANDLHAVLLMKIEWDPKASDPVDVGSLFDLRIHSRYATALGKRVSESGQSAIYPSFTTWCIKHDHILEYKMKVLIAGELVKFEGQTPVVVLAPADT